MIATKEAARPGKRLISRPIDWVIEFAGALSPLLSVLAACLVYVGWGIGLPLVSHSGKVALIALNTEGAVLAAAILFAGRFPSSKDACDANGYS